MQKDLENLRRQLWNKIIKQQKPNLIKCDDCGDPSSNICNCKYMTFVPTPGQIEQFQMDKLSQPEKSPCLANPGVRIPSLNGSIKNEKKSIDYKKVEELMWKKSQGNSNGLTAICNKCGGGSMSNCACVRKKFKPSTREMNIFVADNPDLF
jgi:hypothetical protein